MRMPIRRCESMDARNGVLILVLEPSSQAEAVLISFALLGPRLRRKLYVLKSHGMAHSREVRELLVNKKGLGLGVVLSDYTVCAASHRDCYA